jgi:hypothetical protein
MILSDRRALRLGFDRSDGVQESPQPEACLDLPFPVCLDRASQLEVQHASECDAGTCRDLS